MRRDQRGVALIELLVALVVFTVLVLIIDAVFISAHRGARKAEVGADVNQNARVAVERLIAEIRESSASQIQVGGPGNTQVVFRSARPSDASSSFCLDWTSNTEPLAVANGGCAGIPLTGAYAPVWQRYIGYYFDASAGELRRVVSTSALTAGSLSGGQVIATFVESFTVTPPVGSPATLTVTLKGRGQEVVQGSNVPPQEIVLKATTVIRN